MLDGFWTRARENLFRKIKTACVVNLIARRRTHYQDGAFAVPLRRGPPPQTRSDQDEVDQRDQARRDAAGDQRVVDADIDRLLE